MTRAALVQQIISKKNMLCIGLDSDIVKLPAHFPQNPDGLLLFNKSIIESTLDFCVSYKINLAFYERLGKVGFEVVEETLKLIPDTHFTIADAKRGDIGNTSSYYADAYLNRMNFDSITVAPYMGRDSVEPFLQFDGKWAIILGLTSNAGAQNFELQKLQNGKFLFEEVMTQCAEWGSVENTMFVFGATQTEFLKNARSQFPNHFFLVPGVGSQGGSLGDVMRFGKTDFGGLLINASRSIIYASNKTDFAEAASREAQALAKEMSAYF